jgi:exopolyphosphatase/guanosine-5'-triphosphate,3'-diphosphate pyrophosphatase
MEKAIIASTDLTSLVKKQIKPIFCDVGGGSTEFTFSNNSKIVTPDRLKQKTVRLLNGMVCDVVWDEIEKWIK